MSITTTTEKLQAIRELKRKNEIKIENCEQRKKKQRKKSRKT